MSRFKVGDTVVYVNDFKGIERGSEGVVTEEWYHDGEDQEIQVTFGERSWTVQSSEVKRTIDCRRGVSGENEPTVAEKYINHMNNKFGPKKYNANKPMMSLIRPEFQLGLGKALTYGYTKYGEERGSEPNYLKGNGLYYSEVLDSLERHINAFKSGVGIDEESGVEHLLLAAANLMFLHTYENSDKGKDDRTVLNDDL